MAGSTVATSGFLIITPKGPRRESRRRPDVLWKRHDHQSEVGFSRTIRLATQAAIHSVVSFLIGVLDFTRGSENFMNYVITGTDSAGALSLKRDSAAAAIKKAIELMADGCRDVCITDPDGRVYSYAEFDQLRAAERA